MKALIICVILIHEFLQQQFTVTQYDMLYQLKDLGTDQFEYVGAEEMSHDDRFKHTIDTLNAIMADIMLIVEWNGNRLSPYYIDRQDFLIEQLKKELEHAEIKIDFSRLMPSLEHFMEAIKGNSEEKELLDRYITILNVNNLELMKNSKYVWDFTNKNWGRIVRDGVVSDSKEVPRQVVTNKHKTSKAMFFSFNSEMFEEFKEKEVLAMSVDDNNPIDSQNFMVRYLRHIDSKRQFIIVCVHFKPGPEGLPKRDRHAKEIATYINTLRRKYPEANFILMGNMNAEIQELAFEFNFNVVRLSEQSPIPDNYDPKIIYAPFSFLPDLDSKIKSLHDKRTAMDNFYKSRPKRLEEKDKIELAREEIEEDIEYYEDLKKIAIESKSREFDYWVEVNNFPTAKKIRVQEINFSDPKYERFLKTSIATRPENTSRYPDCTHFLIGHPRFELLRTDEDKELLDYEFAVKEDRYHHRKVFSATVDCFKKALERITSSPSMESESIETANSIQNFLDTLMVKEKHDFILLKFVSDFEIVGVESVPNYPNLLKTGIPNSEFSSDHFPVRVNIKVSDDKKFNNSIFKNLEIANKKFESTPYEPFDENRAYLRLKI